MVYFLIDSKKETINPDEMKIKDELVLHFMTRAASDNIGYNTIGEFQNSDSNTPWYCIVQCTGNSYTQQGNIHVMN